LKRLLLILILLLVLLGVPYGLAKMGIIPVTKLTAKNPSMAKIARSMGLLPPQKNVQASTKQEPEAKPAEQPPLSPPPPRPAQRTALPAPSASPTPAQDNGSRQVGWVAKVYENMEPEEAVRILESMNDREVIALLRRMKQRQVAAILALMPPDRAARLSRALMIQQ